MKATYFDGKQIILDKNFPDPKSDETLIRVNLAGICGTDLEILDGYMEYNGILGHEFVAHADVHYAKDKREISIWEMHAHTYLGSLPLYMLISIIVINWQEFQLLISLNWAGNMSFTLLEEPHGTSSFLPYYFTFMCIVCVFPYIEENIRCLKVYLTKDLS